MNTSLVEIDSNCPTCGAGPSFRELLWDDPEGAEQDREPDYIGCSECQAMHPFDKEEDLVVLDE